MDLGAKKVEIKGDSELVIRQITWEYKCIKENMLMYFAMATHFLECFEVASITHVPRMENQEANELAQMASGYKVSKEKLNDFTKVREKMVSNVSPSPKMAILKTGRGADVFSNKFLQDTKFLPLIIYHSQIEENRS